MHRATWWVWGVCVGVSAGAIACSTAPAEDAGTDSGRGDASSNVDGAVDQGRADLGAVDLGPVPVDTGFDQGGPVADAGDAGTGVDLGADLGISVDLGAPDLGISVDLGAPDLGAPDTGPADLGPRDFGPPDLGSPDLGPRDSGPPDLGVDTGPDCRMSVPCYRDTDGDQYFAQVGAAVSICNTCPAGTVTPNPRADGLLDCNDGLASVNPGVTAFSSSAYVRCVPAPPGPDVCVDSYDYNCSNDEEARYTVAGVTGCPSSIGTCAAASGWVAAVPPACGTPTQFRSCAVSGTSCAGTLSSRTQECR